MAIKENEDGYVGAVVDVNIETFPKGTKVQVKAVDYTSKGDDDQIDIILPNKKLSSIKKSDIKLFEAGVYNSETDINNNPKTDENKPGEISGKIDTVISGVETAISSLEELKAVIEESTSFSSESINTCIAELNLYKTTLSKERDHSNSAEVSA